MPKQKWEISAFTKGIIGSASEDDIPVDASSFSLNIDAIAEDGTLQGIKKDTVLDNSSGFIDLASDGTPAKKVQNVTVTKTVEPVATIDIVHDTDGTGITNNSGIVEITTASNHGLLTGDVINFTGTEGNSAPHDEYDGVYTITRLDDTSFTIPATFTSSVVTDGTYTIKSRAAGTFSYNESIMIFQTVDYNYYICFALDTNGNGSADNAAPEFNYLDIQGYRKLSVLLNTTVNTTAKIAETIAGVTNPYSDDFVFSYSSGSSFTITAKKSGDCPLFLTNDLVTVSTTTEGQGTPFKANDFQISNEGNGIYTLIGIDYSENTILKWEDLYDNNSNRVFTNLETDIVHNNKSTFQTKNKTMHLGLGNGEEYNTKWIGKLEIEQLNRNISGWVVTDDKLESLPRQFAPLDFDIMVSTPIYDVGSDANVFSEQQSYHASVTITSNATNDGNLNKVFNHASGAVFTTGGAILNDYGKTDNSAPKIGWTFKVADTQDCGTDLRDAKRYRYGGNAALAAHDIFMVIDPGTDATTTDAKVEYIGNAQGGTANAGTAAFFMAAQEGSTFLYRVSTTASTDSTASFSTTAPRNVAYDLTEIIDDASGISTIHPCRSPLTSGLTATTSGYMNYSATINTTHIANQTCRALHGVYWIGTVAGNFYRINTMDMNSQHHTSSFNGIKLDAKMVLDYREIGKCDADPGDSADFKHWYGGIYGATGFYNTTGTAKTMPSDAGTWAEDYSNYWSPTPQNSRICGVVETWSNKANCETAADILGGDGTMRYAYDDDSDRDGTGENEYPNAVSLHHHHAETAGSSTKWSFADNKTVCVTNAESGHDVGQIITGYDSSTNNCHDDFLGNTIINKLHGQSSFYIPADNTNVGSNSFSYYSCKVWVLFTSNDNNPYSRWNLMLYNFYPTTCDSDNKVLMYDRTPPYDEFDEMTTGELSAYESNDYTTAGSLPVQKGSMIFAKNSNSAFDYQNSSYGEGIDPEEQPSVWGIIRRDGSCIQGSSTFLSTDGAQHYQFGYNIGWGGAIDGANTPNYRKIKPIPQTLVSDIPGGNRHKVNFAGMLSGKMCMYGYGFHNRRNLSGEGWAHADGAYYTLSEKPAIFTITDTGAAEDDARAFAAYYKAEDAINNQNDYHYTDGGRYKKRKIMGSDNDELYKAGGTSYSTYDGSSLTDSTIPYVNSTCATTLYHGQIGDFLYIDRKWLSCEPLTGTTSKRLLGKADETVETYSSNRHLVLANHTHDPHPPPITSTRWGSNMRFYGSTGHSSVMSTNIRGLGYVHTNKNGCRLSYHVYDEEAGPGQPARVYMDSLNDALKTNIPANDGFTGHGASSRQNQLFCVLPKDDTSLEGTASGEGYNATASSDADNWVYDINRYPPSWEIVHEKAATFSLISANADQFDFIYKMTMLKVGSVYQYLISSEKSAGGDSIAALSTVSTSNSSDSFLGTTMGGTTYKEYLVGIWKVEYPLAKNSYYAPKTVGEDVAGLYDALDIVYNKEYSDNPKLLTVPLIHAYNTADPASSAQWGNFWASGQGNITNSTDAGIDNEQVQFIAPLSGDQLDLNASTPNFTDLADVSTYTYNNSLIALTSGNTGLIDEFPDGADVKYKATLLYDGYQEGPLPLFFHKFKINGGKESMNVTLSISAASTSLLSPRATDIVIYRKNSISELYRMVKQISLKREDWQLTDKGNFEYSFIDNGRLGSYEALSGVAESSIDTSLNYELSAQLNDYLFVAKAYHKDIKKNGSKYIFRSQNSKFSVFDVTKDYAILPSVPTALAAFNGKLYAFDKSNTYRINPDSMVVEDHFEGIGCLGPKGFSVTEYGMCFADANNIYLHDSTKPTPIGQNILSVSLYEGWQIGWQEAVKKSLSYGQEPLVFFDGQSTSFVCLVLGSCDHQCSNTVSRAWAYSILRNRWDYWEAPQSNTAVQGDNGDILLSDGSFLYNYRDSSYKKEWRWRTKKIVADKHTSTKRFHRVKLTGSPTLDTISTPPKWNDDVTVFVDGDIQQLSILNKGYSKEFSGCFFNGGSGGPGTSISDSDTTVNVTGLNGGDIGGTLPEIGTYIMLDDEIMLVTAQPSTASLTVTRAQMGTTAVIHTSAVTAGTEGIENQRLYNISPCIKLPSKCRGKTIEVYLQNQKSIVKSLGIDLLVKSSGF